MAHPHILIIPPWFDIDFQHHFSKSYHRWAQGLAEDEGIKVGLLYGDFGPGLRSREVFLQSDLNYHYLGVRNWGLPKVGIGWRRWTRQYLRAFEQYVDRFGRPTVIHGFSLLGVIAAGVIHQAFQIPYVYTEVLGSMISGHVSTRLVRKAHMPVRKASLVSGISPEMTSALNRAFGVNARLIPLYIDCERFRATPMPPGPVRFISIGSPALTKGMDLLVSAMRQVAEALPLCHLTIVCEPRDESLLTNLIQEHGLHDHITLKGPVPYEAIPGLLQDSHVLISASREESFGYTMVEALATGRPVIASPSPGAKYIVAPHHGRIVREMRKRGEIDPEALAQTMIEVAGQLPDYVAEDMHGEICHRFGKRRILEEWTEIYTQLSMKETG